MVISIMNSIKNKWIKNKVKPIEENIEEILEIKKEKIEVEDDFVSKRIKRKNKK